MGKILVVDDDLKYRHLICEYLKAEGYLFAEAANGQEALRLFESMAEGECDAVLLDVMMPIVDGWTVCRSIRQVSSVPIMMLTARGEEYDKLFGFDLGVDDYMVKPFSPKELMARLRALLKRSKKDASMMHFSCDGLDIHFDSREVFVDKQRVKLTPKEYDVLVFFVKNKGLALSRQHLLDGAWGLDYFGDDRTVDTHVKMLRESLKPYKHYFVTLWGFGYKFECKEGKNV